MGRSGKRVRGRGERKEWEESEGKKWGVCWRSMGGEWGRREMGRECVSEKRVQVRVRRE